MPKIKRAAILAAITASMLLIAALVASSDRVKMRKSREQALSEEQDSQYRGMKQKKKGQNALEPAESKTADLPLFCVENLTVNGAKEPVGLDAGAISFSWELCMRDAAPESGAEDLTQKAFQILIRKAGEKDGAASDQPVWDSGIVKGDRTNAISYEGPVLSDFTAYTWQVFSYDKKNRCAASQPASFVTGYCSEEPFSGASMITMAEEENVYYEGMPVYLRDFSLSGEVERAYLCISALGQYEACLNGERIGDACFAPGWTDYHDRLLYRVYDVTQNLEKTGGTTKENRLAVLLGTGWWAGRNAFGTYDYHRPALIAQLRVLYKDGKTETLSTDESWQYVKDTAIRDADYFNGETYDASLPDVVALSAAGGVASGRPVSISSDFSGIFTVYTGPETAHIPERDRLPQSAAVYEGTEDDGSTYGKLKEVERVKLDAEGASDQAAKESAFETAPIRLKKGQTLIADLGQNMTGVPLISAEGPAGSRITIQFAEMLNDSGEKKQGNDGPAGSLYRASYRSAETTVTAILGQERLTYSPTLFYTGFRYLSVEADADITVRDLRGLFIGNESEQTGSITTDNEDVNRLFENVLWSQFNNFFLVATDCPQRDERLGWTGDLNSFASTSMYNADLRSFYDKWALDLADAQTNEGSVTDTVPATIHTGAGNGGWADVAILLPLNVYRRYGDPAYLENLYPVMERYMDYLSSVSSFDGGRIGPAPVYGDWLAAEQTDPEFLCAMWYGADADAMRQVCGILKKSEEEKAYAELFEKIRKFLYTRYVSGKSLTQTETLFLLHYHLLDPENAGGLTEDALFEQLCSAVEENDYKLATGFAGTPLLLPELCRGGRQDLAYKVLLCRENPSWMYSIDQGATTIWERYDSYTKEKGFADAAMNSFDHFNEGSVAQWMYEQMAGICVDHTMEDPILISPYLPDASLSDTLQKVSGSYHSIYGTITVDWQITGKGTGRTAAFDITVPVNTQAVLDLPIEGLERRSVPGGSYHFEGTLLQ